MIEKDKPKIIEDDLKLEPANHQVFASKKEMSFINVYRKGNKRSQVEAGNATKAALLTFNCKDRASAQSIGCRLVKKFGLKSSKKIIPEEILQERFEDEIFTGPADHGKWDQMQQVMKTVPDPKNNKDIFNEVEKIAFHYENKQTALNALAQLKKWNDELKTEREAQEMADKDIVDLLATALAKIPREKYIEILRLNRQIRLKLINERNKEINVDEICEEVLKQKMTGGE